MSRAPTRRRCPAAHYPHAPSRTQRPGERKKHTYKCIRNRERGKEGGRNRERERERENETAGIQAYAGPPGSCISVAVAFLPFMLFYYSPISQTLQYLFTRRSNLNLVPRKPERPGGKWWARYGRGERGTRYFYKLDRSKRPETASEDTQKMHTSGHTKGKKTTMDRGYLLSAFSRAARVY